MSIIDQISILVFIALIGMVLKIIWDSFNSTGEVIQTLKRLLEVVVILSLIYLSLNGFIVVAVWVMKGFL